MFRIVNSFFTRWRFTWAPVRSQQSPHQDSYLFPALHLRGGHGIRQQAGTQVSAAKGKICTFHIMLSTVCIFYSQDHQNVKASHLDNLRQFQVRKIVKSRSSRSCQKIPRIIFRREYSLMYSLAYLQFDWFGFNLTS